VRYLAPYYCTVPKNGSKCNVSASTDSLFSEFTQRSFGRARSNFTAAGNCTSDLGAVVLGFADVVGDVVSKDHLVSVNNLDRFVVGDVLNSGAGGSGNLTARLHGHGLSKSSDDLEPVLVLHAFVLAGRFSGRPDVVVLSSSSSLEVESGLSKRVNLVHGQLTLDDEMERSDLGNTGRGSSAPVSAGSSHSVLARLKRVLSVEGVEGLLGSSALGEIELVVSHGVLESDLHDVIMDGLADGLGLEESGSLGNGLTGSLGGSTDLGSDSTVSVSSGDVSLSETESGITYGTSGHSLSVGGELGKSDSLSDGTGDLSSGLTDSEVVGSDVLGVGNLGGDSSSDGSGHSELAEGNVGGDPFVESDLLESKSLLGLGFSNASGGDSSSDGGLGEEERFLDSNVDGVSSLVGVDGGTENGVSVNSSSDGDSEFDLGGVSGLDGNSESEDSSLVGGGSLTGNLLGLLHEVTDSVSVLAGVLGVDPHGLGTSNPLEGGGSHTDSHDLGVSGSLLVVDVKLVGESTDDEHLVGPLHGVSHLDLHLSGDSLGVDASLKSNSGTSDSFSHSLLSDSSVVVSNLGLGDLNVLEVNGDLEGSMGSLGISLSLDLSLTHSEGSASSFDHESGLVGKDSEVHDESSLLLSDESEPVVHSLLVEDESEVESVLVLVGLGDFPLGMETVVDLLLVSVLVDGVTDSNSDDGGTLLVGNVLAVEVVVSGNVVSPKLDGEDSSADGALGNEVSGSVLLPGSRGESLLDDNLSIERGGGNSGGSGNLIEEVSSGDLDLGVLEVLGGNLDGVDSDGVVLSVLGLGSDGVTVGFVGGGNESLGLTVEVISLLSVVLGLDVSGVSSSSGLIGSDVSGDHEGVLSRNVSHRLSDNSLAVGNRDHHLLNGVSHLLDVSVTSSPLTSGLAVSLSGESEEVESSGLFLLVSEVSGDLSVDVDLGSLLSGDTEFLLSDSESGGSSGSFSEDLSSGFHSGSGGVVSSSSDDGASLSGDSEVHDSDPVKSHLVLASGVSDVLSGGVSGNSSKSVPVGDFTVVESGGRVVLLGHSDVMGDHLSESDNSESEDVSLLLGDEHSSVVSSVVSLGLNSGGNSLDRHGVSLDSSADSVLGHLRPLFPEGERDLSVLNVNNSDLVVLDSKSVSVEGGLDGNLAVSPEHLGESDSDLGLVDVDSVDSSVVVVEFVLLGNGSDVPVNPLIVMSTGNLDLLDNDADGGLTVLGDVGNHLLVLDNEVVDVELERFDHLSSLGLHLVDHLDNVSDSDVSSLGDSDPVESLAVGNSPFVDGEVSGTESLLGEESVVDGILTGSSGKGEDDGVLSLEVLGLGEGNGSLSVGKSDHSVSNSGVVSPVGSSVVEVEGSLLGPSLVSDGEVVLSLVEGSEVHGVLGGNLGLEESFLGFDSSVDGSSLVGLGLSLHGALDLDLSGIHSLGDLASADGVLGTDNGGSGGFDVDTGLLVLDSLLVNSLESSNLSESLETSGVLGTESGSDSGNFGHTGTSLFVNLADSLVNGSSGGLGSKGSGDLGVLDGDKLGSSLVSSTDFLSHSVSVGVLGGLLGSDLEESLSSGFSLLTDLLLEEDGGLHVGSDSPSSLEDDLGLSGHLTLEEDFSSKGSVSLGNEVRGGLASLLSLELLLLALLGESGDSLLTDVVSLGRAEPIVPLHSVPESTTIFASTVVVGLVLVPVLVGEEGTVGPHPFSFLEEIVSTDPNGGFGVNDRLDLVLFGSSSDGGEMSSPLSASFLGIGPVKFGVGDVLVSGLGGLSLTDELFLAVTSGVGPLSSSVHGATVLSVSLGSVGRLSLSPVGESVSFTGRPGEFSLGFKVVSTDPDVGGLARSDSLLDGVVFVSVLNGSEISSPFKAELSGVGPGSLEVVKGVLLLSVGESLGRLPSGRSSLSSDLSLADVSGSGVTVSVVPFASSVGSVDLSTSFGFSSVGEPVPSHGFTVGPRPVVLGGFTTNPSTSDSVGSTADLVLSDKSVSGSLLGPRVNGREVTTPRSANVSGGFPGLLISSEEEFVSSILVLEVLGSLANVSFLLVASVVVPSVSGEGFDDSTAHLLLVLVDLLGLVRGPEFPSEAVALGGIRPVPGSFNVESVSSHPGNLVVSSSLGDSSLFAEVLDGGELTTEIGGTSGSSFSPGLLGGEEFVLELRLLADSGRRAGVSLVSSAHELSLLVALALAEVAEGTGASLEGTAIGGVHDGHVSAPSSVKEHVDLRVRLLSLGVNGGTGESVSSVERPSPSSGNFEIVVTNPGVGAGNSLHLLRHDFVLNFVFSGSEFSLEFTAVFASGVPVARLLGDPVSPGVGLLIGGRDVSASALGPPDTSVGAGGDDSSSLTDSDVLVSGAGDFNPGSVLAHHSGLEGHTVLGGDNHGSFGTDRDIRTSVDSVHGFPSVSVGSVDSTVLSADNSVTVGIDSDSGSLRSGDGHFVSVDVEFTGFTSVDDSVTADSDIGHLLLSVGNLVPSLGVEGVYGTLSVNNPGVSHVGDSNSLSLDVVSELSPVIHSESPLLHEAVSHDLTVLGDSHDNTVGVSGDINTSDTLAESLGDLLVVLAHVSSLLNGGNSVDGLGVSADEGSLLFAVKVVPSTVLLESETVTSSGGFVGGPVSEGEVSVVVRPSPDLVLLALDGVVASTDPDFFSHLDCLVFLEGVVLVLSEDGGKVPSVSVTVGLSFVPVKGELGDVVPHSLLARLASLVGPGGNTVSGDSVGVSVLADSKSVSSLSVDSVPVVSSGMGSLLLDVSPDSHVVVTGGVLSNDHHVTGRSSSDIKGSTLELSPVLASA